MIVQGGAEAWSVAPALAAAKVPVLVSALNNIPASFDALGSRQENAALLRRAGVPVVITAGAVESFNVRNVKQHAGNAVAYGLPWDEALRAVTLAPAEVFGVADTSARCRRARRPTSSCGAAIRSSSARQRCASWFTAAQSSNRRVRTRWNATSPRRLSTSGSRRAPRCDRAGRGAIASSLVRLRFACQGSWPPLEP